jgi:hypothetical protein
VIVRYILISEISKCGTIYVVTSKKTDTQTNSIILFRYSHINPGPYLKRSHPWLQ